MESVWPWLLGIVLGILFWLFALNRLRRLRLVKDLPTSKTAGVFIGTVEVKGTAECESPLRSYLAESSCIHYTYDIEERWSRTVTETYEDSDGKTKTRTKRESGWKSVGSGDEQTPFYLRDDTGVLRIDPEGAEFQPITWFSEQVHRGDPLYYAKGPSWSVSDSDHVRRFTEEAVPLHQSLYVCGRARERKDIVAAEIAHDREQELFLISTHTEKGVTTRLQWGFWSLAVLSFLSPVVGCLFHGEHGYDPMLDPGGVSRALIAGGVGILIWAVSWLWSTYNSLVSLRNRVRQGNSLIDVQLKRRHDLIPSVVSIVQGLKSHEADLQSALALLRSQGSASHPGADGPDPAGCSPTLTLLRERYPELSSNDQFRKLTDTLSETEQRIALAREYYNDIVTHWNTRLQTFPNSLLAALAKFTAVPLLAAADFERAAVEVKLVE